MNPKWACIICGILLLLGIPTGWPYGYYVLLRWIVCGGAIFAAVGFSKSKLPGWALTFGAIALLFNPIIPVYLNKSAWVGIDLITSIIFFLSAYAIKEKNE